ncbi:endospore germination permease [Virgibacillus sp. 179-BFC.A HS]|uniref:Endospore germination permease n=1 Tax=Tigheibacillus jepli TaxID=3035914 RepID=A0ABU5CHM5_9BACI|nr:endospore germination permease [Virgibacillus sp. 179-BFC.A HS]MDY0405853.1 endospore germination permease [Virgibacillus sp. 179-BFC.A HS]
MRPFEYSDETISEKELLIALPSMLIASGVLSLPKLLAMYTVAADGWIPLFVSGITNLIMAACVARFTMQFAGQPFYSYASKLVTRPVAWFFTMAFCGLFVAIAALEVREIADISKSYLFHRTPVEVIALSFLLVVVYAVCGSRAGILRLNLLFLPIILFIFILLLSLDIKFIEMKNLLPMFQTDMKDYMRAMPAGIGSYSWFGIIWFYIALIKKPKKLGRKVAKVMCIPIVVYLLFYVACIGVFGNMVTANMIYPVVELAKEAELPGGIFERFESVFLLCG